MALVKELSKDLQLVTDSQDVQAVADWLGREINGGCLFVRVQDGDYAEIWHSSHTVPWNEAEAMRLYGYPADPTNAPPSYARNPDPNDPNFKTYLSWSRAGEPNAS